MKIKDRFKLMTLIGDEKKKLKEFEDKINHVIVEYGKWGKFGLKHFSPSDWYLHHEAIKNVPSAHIIILYKDGRYEEV